MKANAPEKFYLNQDDGLIWHCRSYKDDIEYIRTDAFIEKVCKWLKSKGSFTIGFDGATVKDFLDYINK